MTRKRAGRAGAIIDKMGKEKKELAGEGDKGSGIILGAGFRNGRIKLAVSFTSGSKITLKHCNDVDMELKLGMLSGLEYLVVYECPVCRYYFPARGVRLVETTDSAMMPPLT